MLNGKFDINIEKSITIYHRDGEVHFKCKANLQKAEKQEVCFKCKKITKFIWKLKISKKEMREGKIKK